MEGYNGTKLFILFSKIVDLEEKERFLLLFNARTSPKYLAHIEIGFLLFTVENERKQDVLL